MRAAVGMETLEPRAMLATTGQLSKDLLAVTAPVTFQGDTAGPILWQTPTAGQFTWTNVTGDARAAGLPASFKSFCIDGLQAVVPGSSWTFSDFTSAINAGPLGGANVGMGGERANLLTSFWDQRGPADMITGFTDRIDAAAFQLAIWEIVNDASASGTGASFDFAAGSFQVSPMAQSLPEVTRAKQWLQSLDTSAPPVCVGELRVMASGTNQDQITRTPWCPPTRPDTGGEGTPCEPCQSTAPNLATGELRQFADGATASGGGAGPTRSLTLQRDQ